MARHKNVVEHAIAKPPSLALSIVAVASNTTAADDIAGFASAVMRSRTVSAQVERVVWADVPKRQENKSGGCRVTSRHSCAAPGKKSASPFPWMRSAQLNADNEAALSRFFAHDLHLFPTDDFSATAPTYVVGDSEPQVTDGRSLVQEPPIRWPRCRGDAGSWMQGFSEHNGNLRQPNGSWPMPMSAWSNMPALMSGHMSLAAYRTVLLKCRLGCTA